MGNHVSICPEPVQAAFASFGLGPTGGNHPSGIVIQGSGYSTVRLVGEGGYAYIYEGVSNATGATVALKRYVFTRDTQEAGAEEEIRIYESIPPHANIVAFIDSDVIYRPRSQFPEVWMVLEYCQGPSLQAYINNRISLAQNFSVREVYEIVDNVVHAIGHLHSQSPPISHWDVKPDNLIFVESGVLKLCDFGSATTKYYHARTPEEISVAENELEERMTLLYRPPESLDLWSKKRVDTKADIWALGVICYVLVFKEMPFEGNVAEIVDGVPKRFRGTEGDPTPEEFRPLMDVVKNTMLVKDPAQRGDIWTVSEHLSRVNLLPPLESRGNGAQTPQLPRFRSS